MGFATARMQLIPLADGRIIVASENEFNDGSGRKDPGHAEFFRRFEIKPDNDAALRARAVLRQTAETYRKLASAYFEAVSTKTHIAGKSEVRTVTREKISLAPPNKTRVEFDGPGESYVLIDDGVSEWSIYPKANEYRTLPQAHGPLPNGPLSRYVLLDNIRGNPKIVGPEEVQGSGCTLVGIAMDHGVTEQLWIDDATHLVRKDIIDEGTFKEEVVFTTVRLGGRAIVFERTELPTGSLSLLSVIWLNNHKTTCSFGAPLSSLLYPLRPDERDRVLDSIDLARAKRIP
jgi:hypothetical protein